MLLAFAVAAFNQLSGINAILYYTNDIFAAAGFGKMSAELHSVITGATNQLFMLVLTVIDRIGRKTLLIVGSIGMVAALSAMLECSGQARTRRCCYGANPVHRRVRGLAGRLDLGVHRGDLSDRGAGARVEPGRVDALVYGRHRDRRVPVGGGTLDRPAVRLVRAGDAGPAGRRGVLVRRDQKGGAGADQR
jgi:hypothetical protein